MRRVMVLGVSLLVAIGIAEAGAPAMAQSGSMQVGIHQGTCDDLGGVVTSVMEISRTAGPTVGAPETLAGEGAFATAPVTVQGLTDIPNALLVQDGQGGKVIACGGIGGVVNAEGALIFGLAEENRSGVTGIAYLAPSADGSQTNMSVFVAGAHLPGDPQFAGGGTTGQSTQQQAPTAVPTAVPAAVQQGLSDQEQAYIDTVLPIISDMTDSLDAASDLFDNPRIGQDDWKIDLAVQLVVWRTSYETLSGITPPPAFATMHGLLLESFRLYNDASYDIASGLDSLDGSLLEAGANKMLQAAEVLDQATAELNRIKDERGI